MLTVRKHAKLYKNESCSAFHTHTHTHTYTHIHTHTPPPGAYSADSLTSSLIPWTSEINSVVA